MTGSRELRFLWSQNWFERERNGVWTECEEVGVLCDDGPLSAGFAV